jgi:hypothetical protein
MAVNFTFTARGTYTFLDVRYDSSNVDWAIFVFDGDKYPTNGCSQDAILLGAADIGEQLGLFIPTVSGNTYTAVLTSYVRDLNDYGPARVIVWSTSTTLGDITFPLGEKKEGDNSLEKTLKTAFLSLWGITIGFTFLATTVAAGGALGCWLASRKKKDKPVEMNLIPPANP